MSSNGSGTNGTTNIQTLSNEVDRNWTWALTIAIVYAITTLILLGLVIYGIWKASKTNSDIVEMTTKVSSISDTIKGR